MPAAGPGGVRGEGNVRPSFLLRGRRVFAFMTLVGLGHQIGAGMLIRMPPGRHAWEPLTFTTTWGYSGTKRLLQHGPYPNMILERNNVQAKPAPYRLKKYLKYLKSCFEVKYLVRRSQLPALQIPEAFRCLFHIIAGAANKGNGSLRATSKSSWPAEKCRIHAVLMRLF